MLHCPQGAAVLRCRDGVLVGGGAADAARAPLSGRNGNLSSRRVSCRAATAAVVCSGNPMSTSGRLTATLIGQIPAQLPRWLPFCNKGGASVVYDGDPLHDLALPAFLDKFVRRKAKVCAYR